MMDVFEPHTSASLPYGLFLTQVFNWYGIKLNEEDTEVAKEFLDAKSLQQSHLKVVADGTVILVEPPPPVNPIIPIPTSANLGSTSMTEMDRSEDMKEIRASLKVLTSKVTDMADEISFLRDLIAGAGTPASTRTGLHSTTVSGAQQLHDLANIAVGHVLKDNVTDPDVNASGALPVEDAKEDDDKNES